MNITVLNLRTYFRIILIGVAMGVANIIPGVSGGTIAVVFGIYEILMEALGNFYTDKEKRWIYIRFLLVLFFGAFIAIIGLARLLSWSFENYPVSTVYFFIGLIIGSIPVVIKTHSDMKINSIRIVSFIIAVSVVIVLALLNTDSNSQSTAFDYTAYGFIDYIYYFFCGAIAASAMIIPGVSGSFILLMLGIYWTVLASLGGLTTILFSHGFNPEMIVRILLLGSLGIGVVLGILLISRFMNWALKNYAAVTLYAILGLITGSIYQITDSVNFQITWPAIITLAAGIFISIKFGKD